MEEIRMGNEEKENEKANRGMICRRRRNGRQTMRK
jgi:hypothetical protein